MARFTFGGEATHVGVQEDAGNANAFKRAAASTALPWRATPGGTVVTDFLLWGGGSFSVVATAIVTDSNGYTPLFQGPDGVSILYDANGYALVARDAYTSGGGGSYQPLDTDLTAISGLISAANKVPYATGSGTWTLADLTAFARTLTASADAAAARALLGITLAPIRFSAAVAVLTATGSDRSEGDRTITSARMRVTDAPVGSALTAQVQHWNGSTWSTVTTLTIAAGSTTEAVSSSLAQAQVAGNLIRLNVTSVGSTTPAKGAVVDVFVS